MTSDAASKQAQGGGDIFSLRNANTAPMRILRSVFILALFFLVFVIGVPSDEEDGIDRSSSFGARFTVTDATTRHHQMPKMMARSAAVSSSPTGGAEVETSSLSFSNVNEQMTKSLQNLESKTYATSRMLVKSGRMRLEASNVEDTVKKITDILNEYPEGFIESKTQSDNYAKSIHITARVPSEHFEDILESFQEAVGKENVKSISSNAHDITDQYVDAASRSDVLQASRLALQTLLEKAQSVKDVMEVQRELNRVVEQFESQKKIAESLKTQSSLSTITVSIEEQAKLPNPDQWSGFIPARMVQKGLGDLSVVASRAGNATVYYFIMLTPLALLFAAIRHCLAHKHQHL